jgi:hypothetical protein
MKTLLAAVALIATVIGSPALVQAQAVYSNGEYVGADPDSFIRGQLVREHQWKSGGN